MILETLRSSGSSDQAAGTAGWLSDWVVAGPGWSETGWPQALQEPRTPGWVRVKRWCWAAQIQAFIETL